jgi:phage replication-related protein YjqB (UPF0714/DUF867 family)
MKNRPPDNQSFESIAALQASLQRDVHYRIRIRDSRRPITVIAPHGGFIEAGTSEIAQAIAGYNHNLFDFQALRKRNAKLLHVTSTKFRHAYLVDLLARSETAVAIHSKGTEQNGSILIGGLNTELKARVFQELSNDGFPVTTTGPRYHGVHPQNIVNLPPGRGVQIELTSRVIARMFATRSAKFDPTKKPLATTDYFDRFVLAVRRAITA